MTAVQITRLVTIALFLIAGVIVSATNGTEAGAYLLAAAIGAATNAAAVPVVKATVDAAKNGHDE